MRYKLIHFYLPLHHSIIDYRIKHFAFGRADITTERPGSTIEEEVVGKSDIVYNNISGTDVYESFIYRGGREKTDERSNWFIKVIAESDPLFNLDILGSEPLSYSDDDTLELNIANTISHVLPQFLGEFILWLGIDN